METVRNGQKVWPYCSECGCRLDIKSPWTHQICCFSDCRDQAHRAAEHFLGGLETDARGCKCTLLNERFIYHGAIFGV